MEVASTNILSDELLQQLGGDANVLTSSSRKKKATTNVPQEPIAQPISKKEMRKLEQLKVLKKTSSVIFTAIIRQLS